MGIAGPRDGRTKTIVNVQALRAIAALFVVVHHMALPRFGLDDAFASPMRLFSAFLSFGQFGVDLFFVISGFIMVTTTTKLSGSPRAGATFFLRRLVRIFPPYWLALLPVLVVHLYLARHGLHALGGAQHANTNIIASIFLLPHPADEFLLLPPAWTLVFELSFYLVFAVLVSFERRWLLPALLVWAAAEVAMFYGLADSSNFILAFLGTPLPLEFIAGAVLGWLAVHRDLPHSAFAGVLGLAGAGALWIADVLGGDVVYAHFGVSRHEAAALSSYHNNLGRVLLAGLPAFLIVYAAVGLEARRRLVAPRWLVAIGNGSYALYLWNLTIIIAARQLVVRLHLTGAFAHVAVDALTFAFIVTFSLLVYRFFERPVTDALHRMLAVGVSSNARTGRISVTPVAID